MTLFDTIRSRCARVAGDARQVRIDPEALAALADRLAADPPREPVLDPAHHALGDPGHTLAFVVSLDAINFGSGWFPLLRKRPGLSGYLSVATALKERFEQEGPWSARELGRLDPRTLSRALGQDEDGPAAELLALFARALRDLGALLASRFAGRFEALVGEAGGSAERLVAILCEMPFYRDVARYDGREVPFYKRAQLTAADLHAAFEGEGPGRFEDLPALTIFADNLVPHVLRREGVLRYVPELAGRIDAESLLPAGSPAEVEIRACALHAVERCVAALGARGVATSARELDAWLWSRGQLPEFKAHPRHRSRTVYY